MTWHEFINSQKMGFTVYLGLMLMFGSLFTFLFSSFIGLQMGGLSLSLMTLVGGFIFAAGIQIETMRMIT